MSPRVNASFQRSCYSGHKRFNSLIYQTVSTPDGLIFHLNGPVQALRHDLTLYSRSYMEIMLHQSMFIQGTQYRLYGDKAYTLRPWLQVGFPTGLITSEQTEFHTAMNSVREAVEWAYKELKKTSRRKI